MLRTVLVLVHVGVTAAWLGAMLYSIVVVHPRLAAFFTDAGEREDFATLLAAGKCSASPQLSRRAPG